MITLNSVKKPIEPIPPSKNEKFQSDLSELLEKFIEEHDYVSRSDYESDFVNFKHVEEFFAWLSKMAAEDKISLKFEWSTNGAAVSNLELYIKMDASQYEHAQMNYENSLERYHQELKEYNQRYLQNLEDNIASLEARIKSMQEEAANIKKY